MRTLTFGVGGLLITLSCAAWWTVPGGAQDRPKSDYQQDRPKAATPKQIPKVEDRPKDPPQGEDWLTAQELTDRFLVVRAKLDKPEPLPQYEFGEPVVIELDIRNMSERQEFTVPPWEVGELPPAGASSARGGSSRPNAPPSMWGRRPPPISAMEYVVEAKRYRPDPLTTPGPGSMGRVVEVKLYEEPVPLTTLGRQSVELLKRDAPVLPGSIVPPFDDDRVNPRPPNRPHSDQPTPAKVIANLLCDMTEWGEYELLVKFRVSVPRWVNGRLKPVNALKVVDLAPPLRLHVVNRLHKLVPPP